MAKSEGELEQEVQSLKEEIKDLKYEKRLQDLEDKIDAQKAKTTEGDSEFSQKLGELKLYIILSIFGDILFFIFTILVFIRDGELERIKKSHEISQDLKNSHTNWKAFFVIIFLIKVALICGVLMQRAAATNT